MLFQIWIPNLVCIFDIRSDLREVNSNLNVFISRNSNVLRITPIIEFALFTFSFMWFSNVNLLSITTPISFSYFEHSIAFPSSFSLYIVYMTYIRVTDSHAFAFIRVEAK